MTASYWRTLSVGALMIIGMLIFGRGEQLAWADNMQDDQPALGHSSTLSDAELAALVPDFVDAASMAWLEGEWGVVQNETFEGPGCQSGGFMTLIVQGDRFAVTARPEPLKDQTNQVSGLVRVSRGQDVGFFNLTPPDWDDAYFRLKPRSRDQLLAQLYMFNRDRSEWLQEYEFDFERCS